MIKIKKGLDLPIAGAAERRITYARDIGFYAVRPTDYVGLVPRLLVAEGDRVSAGDALLCDKNDERVRFVAPVSGVVKAVVRGEKRKLLAVVVERGEWENEEGKKNEHIPVFDRPAKEGTASTANSQFSILNSQFLKESMLQQGLWPMLRQRPYGTVANPDDTPKAIVVSCFDSAPLAPDYDFALQGREQDLCKGLETLASLGAGCLYMCFRPGQRLAGVVGQYTPLHRDDAKVVFVEGPHPAGNVGTQIAQLCPINKGETVWTMTPQDVAVLGHWVKTGEYCPERVIAVAGPQAKNPQYYRIMAGACVERIVRSQLMNPDYPALKMADESLKQVRVVSGNVLSGEQIAPDGFIGAYDSLLTLLPEGDYYDFMGWLLPGLNKYSFSRTFVSGFMQLLRKAKLINDDVIDYKFDTNMHGGVRPLVFTGDMERVFPFDIYPLQLLKACIVGDVELMEKLGIYEVEPEDYALCEFIDPSKTEMQAVIREALEKLRKEAM